MHGVASERYRLAPVGCAVLHPKKRIALPILARV